MKLWQTSILSALGLLGAPTLWAAVVCTGYTPPTENIDLEFTVTSNTATPPAGTRLAGATSIVSINNCTFTGGQVDRTVYFVNTLDSATKKMLRDSGLQITQYGYDRKETDITAPTVPRITLGYWELGTVNIAAFYTFTAYKFGNNAMYPVETGYVPLGYHIDNGGRRLGPQMYYVRISSRMVNLCPSPIVSVTTDMGNTVNFGTMTASDFSNGKVVTKPFSLALRLSSCQIGLEISVKFRDGNNTSTTSNLNNGLQLSLTNNNSAVYFNRAEKQGMLYPNSTRTIPYVAKLAKQNNVAIKDGPFSKTIQAIISYD